MINISFTHNGTNYHRITKDIARKAYNAGKRVVLCACKVNPCSVWIPVFEACIDEYSQEEKPAFDTLVNSYEYYNCNNRLGSYAAYYIAQ